MPFNYLLDWSLLENNNLNLKNSIIIFDEAHNVDSLAEEGSSMEIDTDMLAQCLVELKNLEQSSKCRYLHKKFEEEHQQSDYALVPQAKSLVIRMNNCLK
jgi:regulator of telomere elongation helicase 1